MSESTQFGTLSLLLTLWNLFNFASKNHIIDFRKINMHRKQKANTPLLHVSHILIEIINSRESFAIESRGKKRKITVKQPIYCASQKKLDTIDWLLDHFPQSWTSNQMENSTELCLCVAMICALLSNTRWQMLKIKTFAMILL